MQMAQQTQFSNGELLAMCKVLLGSQAFSKKELDGLLNKIIARCDVPNERKILKSLVGNELFHYMEQHGADLKEELWELGQAVQGSHYIDVYCRNNDHDTAEQKRLKPVAILYLDQFFYLAAYEEKNGLGGEKEYLASPEVYRVDKMHNLQVLEERFHIPYRKRFEEGEFRKQVLMKNR